MPQLPQLIVLDDPTRIDELRDYLADKDYISYDCETTGLTRRDQVIGFSVCAEDGIAYYVVLQKYDKEKGLVDTGCITAATNLIKSLQGKSLIMHNGTFDCYMAESYFKVNLINSLHTDTMILAHLLDENRRVGLKELATSMFGESAKEEAVLMKESVLANGGVLTKKLYEICKADWQLMGKYGAQDALLTYKVFLALVPELYEQGLDKFFYDDESMPLLRGPTYELNTIGLQVDIPALATLKKTLEAECLEAKAFIHQEIAAHVKDKYPSTNRKNGFNIGSSSQLSWLLFGKLGLEFNTLTKEGKNVCKALGLRLPYTQTAKRDFIAICENSKDHIYQPEVKTLTKTVRAKKFKEPWGYIACDKKTLQKLSNKYKWIGVLLEYQRKTKILNTYVDGIASRVQYGIIQPSFLQHGTSSGRYASRNPNFQNLPRDDKRIKSCIIPRTGKVFVGADYSQLEPRIFAFTSGDTKLLNAFKTGDDFYSVTGIEVYDKMGCIPRKDGSPNAFGILHPKLRQDAKVFTLASTYGATGFQLAPLMGKTPDQAQEDIDNYFEKFPSVKQMMLDSHEQAKKEGAVYNLFGRPRRIPDAKKINKLYGKQAHADLPYEARKLLNLSVNHRIQSTAASIVNRAAIALHRNLILAGINAQIVLQVHDSIIVECAENDAENVSLLMQDAMENTTDLKTISLEAAPAIGNSLAKV